MRAAFSIPALVLALAACSSAPGAGTVASSQASLASPPPAPQAARATDPQAPAQPISESSFADGRDPFQAFPASPTPPPNDARPRKARRIPVDQLKLVALVTHTETPRAMLVDPAGKGYIVTQGELVGRPEPEGDHLASFRVGRIRDGSVVLVREDAASTRVLSLPREPLLQADD